MRAARSRAPRSTDRRGPNPLARLAGVVVCLVLVVTGCSDGQRSADGRSEGGSTSRPPDGSPEEPDTTTTIGEVPASQWRAMKAAGMVRPECPVTRRGQLRRLDVAFHGFDGRTHRGHLVVRRDVAASTARIFTRLFEMKFPIRRMQGVEAYDGDVNRSLGADNTSAYNCRRPDQINAPVLESPHANGRAIDVNPRENPWRDLRCSCWNPTAETAPRTPGEGKVLRGGPVWKLFRGEGWVWQNIKVPDYMHFDTGYPSRARKLRPSTTS